MGGTTTWITELHETDGIISYTNTALLTNAANGYDPNVGYAASGTMVRAANGRGLGCWGLC